MDLLEMMFYAEVESRRMKIQTAANAIRQLPEDASRDDILTTLTENGVSIDDMTKQEFNQLLREIS